MNGKNRRVAGGGSIPRAMALMAGTIAFVAVLLPGLLAKSRPLDVILRAGGAALGIAALGYAAGILGMLVLHERSGSPGRLEAGPPGGVDPSGGAGPPRREGPPGGSGPPGAREERWSENQRVSWIEKRS